MDTRWDWALAAGGLGAIALALAMPTARDDAMCLRRMGPYPTEAAAGEASQAARAAGLLVSAHQGIGGVLTDPADRRHFFTIAEPCRARAGAAGGAGHPSRCPKRFAFVAR